MRARAPGHSPLESVRGYCTKITYQNVMLIVFQTMKHILFNIFLFIVTYFVTYFGGYNVNRVMFAGILLLSACFSALLLTVWLKGNFKTKYINALNVSFPITLVSFLSVYIYEIST